VVVVEFLPTVVVGLLLGPLLDRLERRSLMIAGRRRPRRGLRGSAFAPSAATVVGLAPSPARDRLLPPAVYAGVPNLVRDGSCPRRTPLLRRSRT
jgi:hypothetical protein